MKHNALAITLTLLISALLAAFLWWDYQREVPPPRQLPPAVQSPPPRVAAPPAVHPPAAANGVYRCEDSGGTRYQNQPCESGSRQKAIGAGTLSTVNPPPLRAPAPPRAAEPEARGGYVGMIAQAPREEEGKEFLCRQHELDIKRIDAQARQGSSSETQEWLRERRRWHKDRMWDLRCGF